MCSRRFDSAGKRRLGFTLIEVLVTLVIIGILVAILIPSAIGMRESSRRLECVNRLKQIGLALQNLQSATQSFPSAMPRRDRGSGDSVAYPGGMSGYYELLPYLEQDVVAQSINFSAGMTDPSVRANLTACQTRIKTLICPSDPIIASTGGPSVSYRFNVGNSQPTIYPYVPNPPLAGAFLPFFNSRPEDFTDGLSTTVGLAERSVGNPSSSQFDPKRDFWGAGLAGFLTDQSDSQVYEICRTLRSSPIDFTNKLGLTWAESSCLEVWYNHVAPPNSDAADCTLGVARSSDAPWCVLCSVAARSSHFGGANCLMMDGSVRFVTNGVALPIWRAVGTRAGGESTGSW